MGVAAEGESKYGRMEMGVEVRTINTFFLRSYYCHEFLMRLNNGEM